MRTRVGCVPIGVRNLQHTSLTGLDRFRILHLYRRRDQRDGPRGSMSIHGPSGYDMFVDGVKTGSVCFVKNDGSAYPNGVALFGKAFCPDYSRSRASLMNKGNMILSDWSQCAGRQRPLRGIHRSLGERPEAPQIVHE
jgi:hypothetical protein